VRQVDGSPGPVPNNRFSRAVGSVAMTITV
jgi:hypothetical protein